MPTGIENHFVSFFTTSSAIFVAEAGFCPVIIRPDTTTLHPQSFTYENFAPFSTSFVSNGNGIASINFIAFSSEFVNAVTSCPLIM